jgi:hypothetical protein
MRLFEVAKLKESMTMWVPDAPREMKDLSCDFCEGTGIDMFYNKKTGKTYYPGRPDELKEKLKEWDKVLEKLYDQQERLEGRRFTIQSFYDTNKDAHPSIEKKGKAMLDEIKADFEDLQRKINTRIDRIEKKVKLVKELDTLPCGYCKGKGTHPEQVSDAPEMNLSNSNAMNLMSALGYGNEYGYTIKPEEIPAVKRRIMQLTNDSDKLGDYTKQGGESQKDFGMVRDKDPETGLDRISHKKGPTMIEPTIDIEYLKDKFERMMPILDYAQKHNQEIHFA